MNDTIVIGDVHGCADELAELLKVAGHGRGVDVVLVGDLLAKGPDSKGVMALVRSVGARAVLGNHDAHVLETLEQAKRGEDIEGKRRHHLEVGESLRTDDLAYLERLPLWLTLGRVRGEKHATVVVHAGFVPGVPFDEQERKFLLNLRSIDDDGKPSKRIEGRPWASVWTGPDHVVFGHDALRGLQRHQYATGLDTGCVYGGKLTALLLPERHFVSVKARRAYVSID